LGKQLLRAATSVAANYRAACRGRSKAEFIAKLSIVVEDADEKLLWLELIEDAGITRVEESLKKEAQEILFIMSASRKSARGRDNQ
jgi:four helix bundle protein